MITGCSEPNCVMRQPHSHDIHSIKTGERVNVKEQERMQKTERHWKRKLSKRDNNKLK